eukprot:179732-Prymnesium_polylepis.2
MRAFSKSAGVITSAWHSLTATRHGIACSTSTDWRPTTRPIRHRASSAGDAFSLVVTSSPTWRRSIWRRNRWNCCMASWAY